MKSIAHYSVGGGHAHSCHWICFLQPKRWNRVRAPEVKQASNLEASTFIWMAQQHHHENLSDHFEQYSDSSDGSQCHALQPKHISDTAEQVESTSLPSYTGSIPVWQNFCGFWGSNGSSSTGSDMSSSHPWLPVRHFWKWKIYRK